MTWTRRTVVREGVRLSCHDPGGSAPARPAAQTGLPRPLIERAGPGR
jgi:hypothetical protein